MSGLRMHNGVGVSYVPNANDFTEYLVESEAVCLTGLSDDEFRCQVALMFRKHTILCIPRAQENFIPVIATASSSADFWLVVIP